MTNVPETVGILAECLGVPRSMVETTSRRLGEADLITRGTRGRSAAQVRPKDLAQALIGVLSVGDGIEGVAARVVQSVNRIGGLRCNGSLKMALDDSLHALKHPTLVVRQGSFLDQLTHLLKLCSEPETSSTAMKLVCSVGVTFSGVKTLGWIELGEAEAEFPQGELRYMPSVGDGRRVVFGNVETATLSGMTREARIDIETLARVAKRTLRGEEKLDIDENGNCLTTGVEMDENG